MKTFCFFYLAAIWMVDGASAQSVVPWGGGALARDVASIKHFFAGGTYALAMVKKQPPRRCASPAAAGNSFAAGRTPLTSAACPSSPSTGCRCIPASPRRVGSFLCCRWRVDRHQL